ncbi:tRNA 2-thiouridine(34) synthase MnmA [Desulforudis sp. DRI-14]
MITGRSMGIKSRAAVAMSGGVDSSVTALLLLEKGFSVVGVTMPTSPAAVDGAKRVAAHLGIEHVVADGIAPLFEEKVVQYFIGGYRAGLTPNPCVVCNREIKYGALMDFSLGFADFFATGHYARIHRNEKGQYELWRGVDPAKDQSYVLYHMTQTRLARLILPLGLMKKEEVRGLAEKAGLPFLRAESQEICFIPGDDYRAFLKERCGEEAFVPGPIKTTSGRVVGRHQGLAFYTIGQRRGLGVALGKPAYVIGFALEENALIVGGQEELKAGGLVAGDVSYIAGAAPGPEFAAWVQIRYNAAAVPAKVRPGDDNTATVVFAEPQRAVTPGQAAVFYDGERVIGGGTILEGR